MKLWKLTGYMIVIGIILFFCGFRTALDPMRFTGKWYCAQNGNVLLFSEGFILYDETDAQGTDVVGAYIFARNKILVSIYDPANNENTSELYWVYSSHGEMLCQKQNGSEIVYFSRNPIPDGYK